MDSKIVDDHRSPLISPTRLFKTALRKALSERIKFTVVSGSPVSVKLLPVKTDRQLKGARYLHQSVKEQDRVGGYCDFNSSLYEQFFGRYQDHIPDHFHHSL